MIIILGICFERISQHKDQRGRSGNGLGERGSCWIYCYIPLSEKASHIYLATLCRLVGLMRRVELQLGVAFLSSPTRAFSLTSEGDTWHLTLFSTIGVSIISLIERFLFFYPLVRHCLRSSFFSLLCVDCEGNVRGVASSPSLRLMNGTVKGHGKLSIFPQRNLCVTLRLSL